MSTNANDPTVAQAAQKAEKHKLTPQQKLDGLFEITKEVGTGMLTTRSADGLLSSRAMIPVTTEGLIISIAENVESGKNDDITQDPNVNLSFVDAKTGDWVSISGKATINQDRSKIQRHWSKALSAWFDDKKDGKHTGDHNDPRVALIDIDIQTARYWKADGRLSALAQQAKAAVTGHAASPGTLVQIEKNEVEIAKPAHQA